MWSQVLKGIDMQEALEGSMAYAERAHLYSADEFAASYDELASQFEEWMNSQTDVEQTMNLHNPWLGYRETAYSEILFHVANHGTYHRGKHNNYVKTAGLRFGNE